MTQSPTKEHVLEQAKAAMKIGFIGLGAMGERMATRLVGEGHQLVVYNRSATAVEALRLLGAAVAQDPGEAARHADLVISMVTDDEASRSVWLGEKGALQTLPKAAVAVEMSTVSPEWVSELAQRLEGRGVPLLDAPVLGSRPHAEEGNLVVLVGGTEAALAKAMPALKSISAAVHHVGGQGAGATFKLLANALFGIQVVAIGELLGLAARSKHLDVERLVQVLGELSVTSPVAKGTAMQINAGKFAPLFPIALVEKDMRYALELANRQGSSSPMTTRAHESFVAAAERGLANENINAVAKLFD